MSIVIACPSCGVRLGVGEDLLGKTIRCASCQHVFQAATTPSPASEQTPVASDPPDSTEAAPPPLPKVPPPPKRRDVCPDCGAEVDQDDVRCPDCGADLDEEELRRRRVRRWEDEDEEEDRYRGRRRDSEPHRGAMVLSFGIISIVCGPASILCCQIFSIVGLTLGALAVILGGRDLKAMAEDRMDPEGRGSTNAGWICGLIGLILNALALLILVAILIFYGVIFFSEINRGRHRP